MITKRILSVIGLVLSVAAILYALALFFVFACIVDASRPVADCRQNMAGEVVAWSLSKIIRQ